MLGFGRGSSPGQMGVVIPASQDAVATTNTNRYCVDHECIVSLHNNFSTRRRSTFVSLDTGGFTVNHISTSASEYSAYYLAIAGGDWSSGSLSTKTDGTDIAVTGLLSKPAALLFLSHGTSENPSTTPIDHDMLSIGVVEGFSDVP